MGIFKRASKIAESYVNDAKNNAQVDDPSQILKDMLVQAGEVKRMAGELEFALEGMKADEQSVREKADQAYKDAGIALEEGNEERAREQLVRRNRFLSKSTSLQAQAVIYHNKLVDLRVALDDLREQIDDFKMERRDVEARLASASAKLALKKAKDSMESASAMTLEALKAEARQQEAMVDLHSDIDEELAKLMSKE